MYTEKFPGESIDWVEMLPANDKGDESMPRISPLDAARGAEVLLKPARDLAISAEHTARDGGLRDLADRISDLVDDLDACIDTELMPMIDALEAEARR